MSAFAVTWLPSICSGAMYAAVPMVVAVPVSVVGVGELGDAEVAQASLTVFIEHHVRGLHVSVDDTLGVDVGERGCELPAHIADLIGREWTSADPSRERRPVDQLEDDIEVVALLAGVEHRDQVRVREARQHFGFSVKATSVQRRSAAMDLDRDTSMQHLVVCGEHRAHAPVRQELLEAVAPSKDGPDGHNCHFHQCLGSDASSKPYPRPLAASHPRPPPRSSAHDESTLSRRRKACPSVT